MIEHEESDAVTDLRLSGGRFDQPGLPLDSVHELERFGRIVAETAKSLWKDRNPGKNLPSGFSESVDLRLSRVLSGSVVPVVVRNRQSLTLPGANDVLDDALNKVNEAFYSIIQGQWSEIDLPESALKPLRRFGVSLRKNEVFRMYGRSDHPINWNQSVRRRYLAQVDRTAIDEEGPLIGTIRGLDSTEKTFKFVVPGSDMATSGKYLDDSTYGDLHALQRQSNDLLARLKAAYRVTSDGDLIDIANVSEVEIFVSPETPGRARLVELAGLSEGWLNGEEGSRLDLSALEFARDLLDEIPKAALELPRIYPTPEGGVQLEWHGPEIRIELEIEPDLSFELFALHPNDEETLIGGRSVNEALEALTSIFGSSND